MPRNGSGVYSLPAGSIVANGETIDASQHNPPLQDIASDLNTARPVSAGGTGATTAAAALVNFGLAVTAAQLNALAPISGRNLIINGRGRTNKRGYTSGAATSGANQFTLDRWFVVTSGQNLSWTGNDARRVMTAPAGGVCQVVEGVNITSGTYVLNWTGAATATVNGIARAKGETFTLAENTNVVVAFASGTFTDVQLELGSIPTPYDAVSIDDEEWACRRFYRVARMSISGVATAGSQDFRHGMTFESMRAIPALNWSGGTTANTTLGEALAATAHSVTVRAVSAAAGAFSFIDYTLTMDAEILPS